MTMIARVNPEKLTGHCMLNVLHTILLLGAILLIFAITRLGSIAVALSANLV